MNRRLGICLLGLVAVTLLWSSVAVGATASGESASLGQPLTTPEEFDNTLFRIEIFENGSARWTVQHSRPLRNQTQVDRFERFAAEFRSRDLVSYQNFRTRANNLVAFGANATNRSMEARGFSKDASVVELGQTRGVVEMSFVWTDFAQVEGERVEVGDVFAGGMFVDQGQRLEFRRGPSLAFVDVEPDPDSMADQGNLTASESVTWIGEAQFADQRPYAALEPRESAVAVEGSSDADGSSSDDEAPSQGDTEGVVPMVLAGTLLLLVVAGGLAWYRGYLPPSDGGPVVERPTRANSGSASSGTRTAGGGGAAAAQVAEEELLSDEDRVLKLLDENGGRMKQVAIVEKTDWSKSKVSMLLSDMEEDGQISKLRLGRENIISLAGQEPDAAGSPFDDE